MNVTNVMSRQWTRSNSSPFKGKRDTMLIVTMRSAKSIARQHLLRLHSQQHKGRLDLELRTRTHAMARVGGGTAADRMER